MPPETPTASIKIMCPNLRCRAVLAVPTEARGRLVRCKNCGTNIKVPKKTEQTVKTDDNASDNAAA